MILKTLKKIPRTPLVLACSGGPDSMAVFDFLRKGHHDFIVAYFNHGTEHGKEAELFVRRQCEKYNVYFFSGSISREKNKKESQEEFWRKERYLFLRSFGRPVVVCHHLDDAVETWLFSSFNGQAKLIPYHNNGIIRPFLITRKEDFIYWCQKHDVEYIEDLSNEDEKYMRNYIRKNIIPHVLNVNPGIHKIIKKKIIKENK